MMTQFMNLVSKEMSGYLDGKIAKGENVNFSDLSGRFAMDVISSWAFGVEASSFKVGWPAREECQQKVSFFLQLIHFNLQENEDLIVQYCKKVFSASTKELFLAFAAMIPGMPQAMGLMGMSIFKEDCTQ